MVTMKGEKNNAEVDNNIELSANDKGNKVVNYMTGQNVTSDNIENSNYIVTKPATETNTLDNSPDDTNKTGAIKEGHQIESDAISDIEDDTGNSYANFDDDAVESQSSNTNNEKDNEDLVEADRIVEENEDAKLEGVPVDRGWAWAVLAGCVLYILLWGGVVRSYGVFFLKFQERFHAKAAEVAIMNIIQNIIISITGLLTMTVVLKKFSCRTVVAIGGFFNALSHIISGITKNIRVFYFSNGLIGGAGIAMVGPPMISTLGLYFKKHRGLANSIFTASASVGGLIFAPVFTTLFEEYGYTGTMLIVAGFLLNSLVSASVMRPPSWFTKRHKVMKEGKDVTEKLIKNESKYLVKNVSETHLNGPASEYTYAQENRVETTSGKLSDGINSSTRNNFNRSHFCHSDSFIRLNENENNIYLIIEGNPNANGNTVSAGANELKYTKSDVYISGENLYGSFISVVQSDIAGSEKSITENTVVENLSCLSSAKAMVADFIKTFDYKLLKDLAFLLYLAMAFVTCSGMVLIPIYLAPFAKDAGLSYDDIAIMISILACVDVASKIVSGIIADRQWIRRTTMLAFAAFATGTVCHIARFCTNKPLILTMAVLMACFNGWYTSMYATILIDTIGLEKFQSSLGFVSVIHGLSVAVFFPLSGLLRDIEGSYIHSLHLAGGLCYIGTVFLVLLPVAQKRSKHREAIDKLV